MNLEERRAANPLRLVLVGCGAVSEVMYRGPLQHLQAEGRLAVSALVDPNAKRLGVLGAAFPNAARFANLPEAFSAAGVPFDVAIIASPPKYHCEQTLFSLRNGCHVLCEKPFAMTAAECEVMIAEANRQNRKLSVGLFRRYYPSVQAIGELLQSGILGPLRSFSALEGSVFNWPLAEAAHAGVLADTGPHTLDLLRSWLGPLELVSYSDDALGELEANCHLRLSTRNGVTGDVHLSRDTALAGRHVIHCEKGWVAYTCDDATAFTWGWNGMTFPATVRLGAPGAAVPMWRPPGAAPYLDDSMMVYFTDQIRDICRAASEGTELLSPPTEALEGVRLMEQCYASRSIFPHSPWLSERELSAGRMAEAS